MSKCEFVTSSTVYLGLEYSSEGLRPVESSVQAIKQAPVPKNVAQLRSFLGMVQYYHQFLPNLATALQPLHELLKKGVVWKWTKKCQKAYEMCKANLTSKTLLVHYDQNKKLKLDCDASSYGVGAVLSHVFDNGDERPIAYASRTLSPSERNYAQIEREALSLVFGVKKFHDFLYGRKFTLVTDHKPLLAILGPKAGIPTIAAARMQRWALILQAYDYEIEYRNTAAHANCDALSRLPSPSTHSDADSSVFAVSVLDESFPVLADDIAKETRVNPILCKVYDFVLNGWPNSGSDMPDALKPYYQRKDQLSIEQGCLLWGTRVVIPRKFRDKLLNELHWEHPGVCAMKALARSHVWWPGIDSDIENKVKACSVCQRVRQMPAKLPLHPWVWPVRPFQRVHIDFCEDKKLYYLVLVDCHSKWVDIKPMKHITAERTIDELRLIFAEHGLPEQLVSDNGPQFTSVEFDTFMKKNGIDHIKVAPYHPASNGAAERAVRLVKEAFTKQVLSGESSMSLKHRIANFLLRYRVTPHSTTGVSPSELLCKRQLRTRLTLVKPSLAKRVEKKQKAQKEQFDRHRKQERYFDIGDIVRVKNPRPKGKTDKWLLGSVIEVKGPRNYIVKIGSVTKLVHADHMVKTFEECETESQMNEFSDPILPNFDIGTQPVKGVSSTPIENSSVLKPLENTGVKFPGNSGKITLNQNTPVKTNVVVEPVLRRSCRVRKPVVKMNL